MELHDLARHWTAFGEQDPLWAVLTVPQLHDGSWGIEEFLATGRQNIDEILARAVALGVRPARLEAALDFGCGVGRLSQALAEHFERVSGVDIAPTMIEYARRINPYGERLEFLVNDRDDLSVFPDASFDLVFTLIVLQHMRADYQKRYLREFVRLLRPGGLAVFQLPVGPLPVDQVRALPDGAYAAELAVRSAPSSLAPGSTATVTVRVTNRGDVPWPVGRSDSPAINVGNHWRTADGATVNDDDGRGPLLHELAPGASVDVEVPVTAPAAPGSYVLELDVVHEAVTWFAARGSRTITVPVRVTGSGALSRLRRRVGRSPSSPSVGASFAPVMEIHTVPEDEVRELVAEVGGRVVAADEDWWTGPVWASRTFYVTR